MRAEVKEHAREQIATAGASALSLNAIAKRMGMSGPALYRYFAGRDELISELVRDAYRSLADTFRDAAASGADLTGLAHTMRSWALADPQRYFLVFGTPVPGYHAPADVTQIASETMAVIIDACAALPGEGDAPTAFDAHLDGHRQWASGHPAPPRRCTGPCPSGPGCTASCPWSWPVTSPACPSTRRSSTPPSWTTCRHTDRGAAAPLTWSHDDSC